jgi:hypothetical protein
VLHGFAWGVRGPLMGAMRADYFGREAFASVMGFSSLVVMFGSVGGPLLVGPAHRRHRQLRARLPRADGRRRSSARRPSSPLGRPPPARREAGPDPRPRPAPAARGSPPVSPATPAPKEPAMTPLVYTDPATARRYVDAVTSLSVLGEARFGRPLVLANYTDVGPTLTASTPWRARSTTSRGRRRPGAGHPRAYMTALLRASRTLVGILRGEERPYRELVQGILEIDHRPIPESETRRLRAELHEGLGLLGYEGELERQVPAWLADTSLTGDAVIEFGQSILDDARRATEARVLKLPPGEGVDSFTGVRDIFYSGRSQYTGGFRGWLHFNIDKDWQRDLFVHVLCHEAYPGHQTFYALWDELYQQGRWPVEAAYYQLNNPTNAVFEGGPRRPCTSSAGTSARAARRWRCAWASPTWTWAASP